MRKIVKLMKKKPLKILILTRYTATGASSRLRIIQYLPFFKSNNIAFLIAPFFNERYLTDLYSNKKINFINLAFLYVKRFAIIFTVKKYDLIWIEKEVFPFMPSFVESIITIFNTRYIVDYDDAIFHNYDRFKSNLFKNKFNYFLRKSSLVVVCNEYLWDLVNKCGATNILQIPTVVDMKVYQQKEYIDEHKELRIGWIGSPSTSKYLYLLKDVLEKISKKYAIKLIVIGGSVLENFDVPLELHKWSKHSENDILKTFDIGIMPLKTTKWEEGKCGFKLIQYMASGLPIIASCVGFNRKIVDKNIGFLANNDDEWEEALEYFIKNRSQIQVYGKNARKKAEKFYALQSWSEVMLKNIQSISN